MDESFLYIRYTILEEMKKFLETCFKPFPNDSSLIVDYKKTDDFPLSR